DAVQHLLGQDDAVAGYRREVVELNAEVVAFAVVALDGDDAAAVDALLVRQGEDFLKRAAGGEAVFGDDVQQAALAALLALALDGQGDGVAGGADEVEGVLGAIERLGGGARQALPADRLGLDVVHQQVADLVAGDLSPLVVILVVLEA